MLEQKIAFITGSNRGIGLSVVNKFAENGAIVYANARKSGSLKLLQEKNYERGCIIPLYFDITDRTQTRKAFIRIKEEQGRLDCLVNNAGILVDTHHYAR